MTGCFSRRRLLGAALGGLALPLVVACGGGAPPAAPTSAPAAKTDAPAAATAQPATSGAPAAKGKVMIRRAFWGSPDQIQIAKENDKRFLDTNPDIDIEHIAIPWESYRDKLMTMIAGGDVPDVMGVDAYWTLNFVERKMLKPLDDLIKADKDYSNLKVIKGMWPIPDHHAVAGKTYGAITAESPRILFFNKTMFNEAGLKDPVDLDKEGKWDWNAYLDAAKKLTKGSGTDKVFGVASFPVGAWMYNFIDSNGGKMLSDDRKKCLITMPETVEALQFQVDLIRLHKVSPLPEETQILGGNDKAFVGKRLAMTITGIWAGADYRHIKDFEWVAGPIPKSPRSGYRRTNYKPNATAIPTATKQTDAAWRFLAFDPLGQNRAAIDKFTAMTVFEDNKQYFLEKSPVKNARVVFDHFDANEITYVPLNTKWFEMQKIIDDEMTLARSGEKTVAEAAKAIEPKVTALLGGS